jgi:ribulose-5-phosphate 4-epimerase/fuculose-1-phosphate aldolase
MPDKTVEDLREQVAKCTRLLVMQEVMDYSGHVSARIPGTDRILIQPRDTSRLALGAADLLVVDLDGKVLEGSLPAPMETALHTSVYRARPDARAVCHGHPTFSTLFSVVDRPLLAVRNFAYRFANAVPVHSTRRRFAASNKAAPSPNARRPPGVLARAHGTVGVSSSVRGAVDGLSGFRGQRAQPDLPVLGPLVH